MHYRMGWLVERLNTLESVHLLRQGLDVRPLSAERPPRKRKGAKTEAEDEPNVDATDSGPKVDAPVSGAEEP